MLIDVDLGCVDKAPVDEQSRYPRIIQELITTPGYMLCSLNTSLGFAYIALGRMDGFLWMFIHPWDYCAGAFLIQEAGGIVTSTDGRPWEITDGEGLLAAMDPNVHESLLNAYKQSA